MANQKIRIRLYSLQPKFTKVYSLTAFSRPGHPPPVLFAVLNPFR
jgi:hypothetical protein